MAALFYLITCQNLFEAEEPDANVLLKGIGENRFRLRRKAVISMFEITEGMLHGALRKIKDSPPINRIKSKWADRQKVNSSEYVVQIVRSEPSVTLAKKRTLVRPVHSLPDTC